MRSEVRGGPGLAAEEIADVAERRAGHAESDRRLSPEVVGALTASGFARHFVPTRWGGNAGSMTELLRAVTAVGHGCTSTAWCGSLFAGSARMGAFLPIKGQQEIWNDGPDALIVGGLSPSGRVERVSGGWRVSGEWSFVSAVDYSDWALVCAPAPSGDSVGARFFAVARTDFRIRDTWHNVGMRATGSNTLVLDEVVIPEHRTFSRDDMWHGRAVESDARCHTVALRVASGLLFAGPALGAARGAVDAWSSWIARKQDASGTPACAGTSVQLTQARAAGEVDAAELLLHRAAAVADRESSSELESVRNPRDCSLAMEALTAAVDRLFRASGTHGQDSDGRVQRVWRDVNCIASHVALRFEGAASGYARHVLGVE